MLKKNAYFITHRVLICHTNLYFSATNLQACVRKTHLFLDENKSGLHQGCYLLNDNDYYDTGCGHRRPEQRKLFLR